MPNKDFYKASDIPQFQQDVCLKTCICKGKCIEEGKDNHWFLMCPHYFNWKLDVKSFVIDQLQWEQEHPEEAEAKHKALVERAKAWKASQKKTKTTEKKTTKKKTTKKKKKD